MRAYPQQGGHPAASRVGCGCGCVCFGCKEAGGQGRPGRERNTWPFQHEQGPLCVAQGVGCGSRACGQEPGSQHLQSGRGAKHFLQGRSRPSCSLLRAWSQPKLSPLDSSSPHPSQKTRKTTFVLVSSGHRSAVGGARPGLCGKWEPRWTVLAFGEREASSRHEQRLSFIEWPLRPRTWAKHTHTSSSPPGWVCTSKQETLCLLPLSIPRAHAQRASVRGTTLPTVRGGGWLCLHFGDRRAPRAELRCQVSHS